MLTCLIICDITPLQKSTVPTPAFNFVTANHPNKKKRTASIPFWEPGKKNDAFDTAALKQSNWYADVIKNIEASEYEIKKDGKTGMYIAPNRQQQLMALFNYNSFTLQPQNIAGAWTLSMRFKGIYADKKSVANPKEKVTSVISGNKIVFSNTNFSTEYINNKEGVRQNFIIQKEPASKPQIINIKLETTKHWYINKIHDKELHFAKVEGDQLSKKITYNGLKVWDANNRELDAKFIVNKKHDAFEIEVNATDALYPITIDPLSSSPSTTLNGSVANANFGYSVSGAGDVNGDGYSDVIVGTQLIGSTWPGAAYVFYGSSTGLSTSPATTLNGLNAYSYFGCSVSCAGDVNGDGYSDVIVGAFQGGSYGAAYVFLGSSTGLATSPATTMSSVFIAENLGWSVSCAGDVNGDGYSDVMVGNISGTTTDPVRIYMGSSTGLSATPAITLTGVSSGDKFGTCVSSAGDVNGDGYSDVIVGAYGVSANRGAAYVYLGSSTGLSASPSTTLNGVSAGDNFGLSVSDAGDINGDGYSDVIVGASAVSSYTGAVYVFLGSSTGLSASSSNTINGISVFDSFGWNVSSAGDVNGDGYGDVIFYGASGGARAVNVYTGSSTGLNASPLAILTGISAGDAFGYSISGAGDVNGDGYSDIIIGATGTSSNTGAAYTYHGSPDGLSATYVNTPDDADQAGARFGISVASAGDVNGDGYSDVIIGAYQYADGGNANEGRAFVYHGSAAGLSAIPNSILDDANQVQAFFGFSVASAGDVNGDGYGDVIIGAHQYDDGASFDEGAAFVYHGSATGLAASPNSILDDADQAGAGFGISVACAGDVNGDGYSDVIVGAWQYVDGGNTGEGRAFVYHGSATGLSATPNSTPDDANQVAAYFGWSVASAGDVNGDGYSDVIIGAYFYNDGINTDEGRAFVYYGSATGISATPDSTPDDADQAGARFGWSVACAGDVNGDGYSDVIIGAPFYFDGVNPAEGRAFLYYGSASGLSATPNSTPDDADQAGAAFGWSVASAGDVNGDGYSDVIIGAWGYDDGANSNEGRAFVYYGSATGLSATPNSTPDDADQAFVEFGYSVASAGDINGDGYSDVIIGAPSYKDGPNALEGRAFVYYGNGNGGLRNNLRLYNTDLVTPIQRYNMLEPNLFGAGLFSKSPLGRVKGKLVWEVKQQGQPFSGNPIANSTAFLSKQPSYTDLGIAGTELKYNVQKQGRQNKIRVRVEYNKATAINGQVYGPWRYPPAYLQGAHGMNAVPLPVKLNSFNGALIAEKVKLDWSSSDDDNVATYQIERSGNNRDFTAIAAVTSLHQNSSSYNFTDNQLLKGKSWYRLRITDEQNQTNYSKTILIKNNNDAVFIYPTVIKKRESVNLQFKQLITGALELQMVNMSGITVFKKTMTMNGNIIIMELPSLSSGVYILSAMQNDEKLITQKIILR